LRSHGRRGGVTLELILAFPIWLFFLLAVIELGLLESNLQQVVLASRVGAEEASQISLTGTTGTSHVPQSIVEIVEQQLESAGIAEEGISQCRVILEHNVDGAYVRMDSQNATCDCCAPPDEDFLPSFGRFVRVTVCVPMTAVTPNLLSCFGFDTADHVVQQSTTFRHELH